MRIERKVSHYGRDGDLQIQIVWQRRTRKWFWALSTFMPGYPSGVFWVASGDAAKLAAAKRSALAAFRRRVALTLLLFVGCGEPCRDWQVTCAGRDIATCVDGEWHTVTIPCGYYVVPHDGTCAVPYVACPTPVRD